MKQILSKAKNVRLFLVLAWRMYHANNTRGYYHWYVKRISKGTISWSIKLNDGTIPDRIFKKIQWYMVEAVIMGEMLSDLTGASLKKNDRKILIYLGAIMALFDAMVDDFKLDIRRMKQILDNTFSTTGSKSLFAKTAIEKVFCLYLDRLLCIIEAEQWSEIAGHLGIIRSQIESVEQLGSTISEENVTRITLEKGGVSSLICSAFVPRKKEDFLEAVFQTGGFIQMMNDCQDLYKDTNAGIKTFIHFCVSFPDIYNRLNRQRIKTFSLIESLELPLYARYKTLFDLNAMFIMISYKLHRYAEACNYSLDFDLIAKMDRNHFRINPFSSQAVYYCTGRIVSFDPENYINVGAFKFSS
ncbi:MAG TPA: hypothetical protein VMV47_19190 [Bacteroidales bacterium]|nr:hypothetical protein [Bacteroidales bacterium]